MTNRSKHPIEYSGVIEEMKKKYDSKLEKYGESWKSCELGYLVDKLRKEIDEFESAQGRAKRTEAVDIANMASMILARALGHEERIWDTVPGRAFRSMGGPE